MVVALSAATWGTLSLYRFRTEENTLNLRARAQDAARLEDWESASTAFRQFLQREPDDLDALQSYADVLIEQMKTTPTAAGDAVRALQRLVSIQPDNLAATEKLTVLYLGLREFGLAEQLARTWQSLDPKSSDANIARAFALHRVKKSREAADALIAAIEREPDEVEYFPLLIQLLGGELNEPDEAARRLAAALRIGPDSPGVQFSAFLFHEEHGTVEKAEEHLERALSLAPDSIELLLPAGLFYLSRGRMDEAEALLNRAARIAPDDPAVLAAQASWATQAGDTDTLTATADRLLDLAEKKDPDFLASAAELYLRAGLLDRVEDCLAEIDSLPRTADALSMRVSEIRGACALLRGAPYKAISHLRHATRLDPSNTRTQRMLVAAFTAVGELEAAVDTLRRIAMHAPRDTEVRFQIAELAWRRGRVNEARDAVRGIPNAGDALDRVVSLIKLACELREKTADVSPPVDAAALKKKLEELSSEEPENSLATRWLMRCFVLAGRHSDAANLVHAYRDDSKFGPELGMELGQHFISEGLTEHALQIADDLVRHFPNALEPPVLRVKALVAVGGLSVAAEYADSTSLPQRALQGVWETVADAYVVAGQVEPALELYRRTADRFPDNVPARRKIMRHTMDLDEATQSNQEIRSLEGDDGLQWKFELANVLLRLSSAKSSRNEALELLEQCLAERPRWLSARLLIAYAHEMNADIAEAVESYEIAIAQEPRLRTQPAAIRLIGLLYELGRLTQAEVLLEALMRLSPEDPSIMRLRTEQQIRQRDFDSAIATAERLLVLRPDDPAWTVVTADLHLRVGNAARAEAIARDGLARAPSSPPLLWSLSRALIAQGRNTEAEAMVRGAVDEFDDALHYVLWARVLSMLDNQAQAEQAIAEAQRREPDDAAVWAACADFWGSINRRARQVDCVRKSIELQGEDPANSLSLARLLGHSDSPGDRAEARDVIKRRLEADPEDFLALLLDGELALVMEPPEFSLAEASLEKALSIDPRSAEAYRLMSAAKFRSGQMDAAGEAVATGLAFVPDDPDLLLIAAELYCFHGEYLKAIAPLRRLLEIQPRAAQGVRLLAAAFAETGRLDRAVEFVEGLAPLEAMTATELLVLARLLESKGDLDEADSLYMRAAQLDESSASTFSATAQFHARRGRFDLVHSSGVRRRSEFPDDVASLAVVAELLGAQSADDELRQTGMTWLEQIAREHPQAASNARYRLGMCHYRHGDFERAAEQFIQSAVLSPEAPQPVNALAWMYAEDLGRLDDARAVVDRFLAAGGQENAALLDTHAIVLLRLGELAAATRKLTESIKVAGQTPTLVAANYHLGLVSLEQQNVPAAHSYIKTALRLAGRLGGLTPKEREKATRIIEEAATARDAVRP